MDPLEPSHLREFSLRTLAELYDGRVDAAFSLAMTRLADDVNDRPGDNRPRVLTLKVGIIPNPDEDGTLDSALLSCEISEKVPARSTKPIDMGIRRRGGKSHLVFSPAAPDNHRQPGLPLDPEDIDK